ncbi:MAG: hypothetical protein ABI947_03640 [Chloroflexota bacterium]
MNEREENAKKAYLEVLSTIPGVRFIEFIHVGFGPPGRASALSPTKLLGRISIKAPAEEIISWMRNILILCRIEGIFIFKFFDYYHQAIPPWAKVHFSNNYEWIDKLYFDGRALSFLSEDGMFLLIFSDREGYYEAETHTETDDSTIQ